MPGYQRFGCRKPPSRENDTFHNYSLYVRENFTRPQHTLWIPPLSDHRSLDNFDRQHAVVAWFWRGPGKHERKKISLGHFQATGQDSRESHSSEVDDRRAPWPLMSSISSMTNHIPAASTRPRTRCPLSSNLTRGSRLTSSSINCSRDTCRGRSCSVVICALAKSTCVQR